MMEKDIRMAKEDPKKIPGRMDLGMLCQKSISDIFCHCVLFNAMQLGALEHASRQEIAEKLTSAMVKVADVIPRSADEPKRPWISSQILEMLEKRK